MRFPILLMVLVLASSVCADTVDFARDIRPILSNKCFQCHGPDVKNREADLRLHTRAGLFEDRDGYSVVVPHKPMKSEAYLRIISDKKSLRMPPAKAEKPLSPSEIDLIRRWIEQGAKWQTHWAFEPPRRPEIPKVQRQAWVNNPIDAFVLAKLEREGLAPSQRADRLILLRRLSLDLLGLPPSLKEADRFLADESEHAYARVVDRLLNSPHYGERWARHWLDAARYADSDGFEKDKPRNVWFYRDWVIDALNEDMPFDRFVVEQLAGDLLPNATQSQKVATGFLRNSMINEEGGVDPEQFRMEAMFDRVGTVGKSLLGLTIECAQCHDHKYDPLTQRDYYRLFAFLNNSHEAQITVYTPEQQLQRRQIFAEIEKLEDELRRQHPDWQKRFAEWESQQLRKAAPKWQIATLEFDAKTLGGQKFLPQPDGSYLAQSYAPTKTRPRMIAKTPMKSIAAIRLELLTDPNLPHGGPGRSVWGTAALTEFDVEAAPANAPSKRIKVKIGHASANVAPPVRPLLPIYDDRSKKRRVTGPIDFAIDGDDKTAWGTDNGPGRRNQSREAVFRFAEPIESASGAVLDIYPKQNHGGWNSDDNQTHNIGRFRISLTDDPNASANPIPHEVRDVLAIPKDERTPEQKRLLFSYWRTTVPEWQAVNRRIERLWQSYPEGTSQLVLQERDKQRTTHRLDRGDFLARREVVTPGVPSFLHPLPESASPNRLTFARWLVDPRSPTTARAIVNRVWQTYFGVGLVRTSGDLGSQGETPTHPELLDWLAVEFVEKGWSLKKLHRLIVSSATYQQSSRVTPTLLAVDPYNRLLARGPRFRVEAEVVRDIALSVSGLLDPTVGGPSVYPKAPDFLFVPPASYGPKVWKQEGENYRRALYTFRFRSVPYPALQSFDAPNGDSACVRRSRSNTPLQALATLNEPIFLECARAFALRIVREGGTTPTDRLRYAFRQCLTRRPSDAEAKVLLGLWKQQRTLFEEEHRDPWEFAVRDPSRRPVLPEGTSPTDLAAWTAVARVLLNLDETITKE